MGLVSRDEATVYEHVFVRPSVRWLVTLSTFGMLVAVYPALLTYKQVNKGGFIPTNG